MLFLRALTLKLLILVPSAGFCADLYRMAFLGFSANGRYLAFEEEGTNSMSGVRGRTTFLIDADSNAWVGKPRYSPVNEDGNRRPSTPASQRERQAVKKLLKRYGITGKDFGTHAVSRPETTEIPSDARAIEMDHAALVQTPAGVYDIADTSKELPSPQCYSGNRLAAGLTLILKNQHGQVTVLQEDRTIPAWRNCACYYRIKDIYVHNERIAIFLQVFLKVVEGPEIASWW
jgi:predicted secreted protein